MQEVEFPDDGVTSEMPASSVMINSPQFNSVMEQMSDLGEKVPNGMKKKATTTCMWKPMPLIEVTCFDDEAYSKKIQNELENTPVTETNEATAATEESIIVHSAAQQNNERQVNLGDSGNNKDARESIICVERNSWVENNTDGVQSKKVNTPRKCLKGFVVRSPQISNRVTNQTKAEVSDTETKRPATDQEERKNSEPSKSPRKPDSRQSEVLASPSTQRRRNTVCSFSSDTGSSNESQNNSELRSRKVSVPRVVAAQNASRSPKLGERKLSSEILNGRKKPERIDLSFKMDLSANDSKQSKEFRKRSRTYEGKTQKARQATSALKRSSSEEHIPDGDFRMHHDNRRLADGNPSPSVRKPRGTFEMQESNEFLGISESSFSLVKNAGVVSSTDTHSISVKRVPTSILHGVKSTSKGVSEKQPLSQVDVTQRLNLSPPRRRRVGTPRPPQDHKQSYLGVSTSPTRIKSETDLRKLVSEEQDAEKQKQVCFTTPPRLPRGSDTKSEEKKTSLGVSGKLSLRKSETDLRKLLSDEELANATRRPSLASPQRLRKLSFSKPLTTPEALYLASSATSSPVSPHIERKIYLAAAKPAARLPVRAKVRNDLAASSQIIIDQAKKELDQCSECLPHISVEEVMKSWHTDSRHWNVVSSLVKESLDCASKTNMEAVKNCRYIRDGVLRSRGLSQLQFPLLPRPLKLTVT